MGSRKALYTTLFLNKDRYFSGSKKLRTEILSHIQSTYRTSRKSLIRLMNRSLNFEHLADYIASCTKKPGRPKLYDDQIRWWLETLWLNMDFINSKAMKEALPLWLKFHDDPSLSSELQEKLLSMSPATIDRLLDAYRRKMARLIRSGTRRGRRRGHVRFFENRVPIKQFDHKITRPGHMEADTVAHCGGSMAGQFIWTLNLTDHLTGWCEQRAVWHKRDDLILDATIDIQKSLPFAMKSIHTDCGMEFLNSTFVDHFCSKDSNVFYTRSRPYHKNDNARIEQKNFTHVRRVLGYERIDQQDLVPLINDLYSREHSWLMNFFVPQKKLIEKIRVGPKTIKRYDKPKTPYQRLLESGVLSQPMKEKLDLLFVQLNPFELSKRIKDKLARIEKQLKENQNNSDQNSDNAFKKAA
jgi:hypothetical protein